MISLELSCSNSEERKTELKSLNTFLRNFLQAGVRNKGKIGPWIFPTRFLRVEIEVFSENFLGVHARNGESGRKESCLTVCVSEKCRKERHRPIWWELSWSERMQKPAIPNLFVYCAHLSFFSSKTSNMRQNQISRIRTCFFSGG